MANKITNKKKKIRKNTKQTKRRESSEKPKLNGTERNADDVDAAAGAIE